jgi:hypothetical protein
MMGGNFIYDHRILHLRRFTDLWVFSCRSEIIRKSTDGPVLNITKGTVQLMRNIINVVDPQKLFFFIPS